MAEILVSAALILVENVLSVLQHEFSEPNLANSVVELKRWLTLTQSFLRQEESIEGSEVHQNQVVRVRELAHDIEDALEKFILEVSYNYHSHTLTRFAHGVVHFGSHHEAVSNLHDNVEKFRQRIKEMRLEEITIVNGASTSGQGPAGAASRREGVYHSTDSILQEDELVGYEEHRQSITAQLMGGHPSRVTLAVVGPGGSGKTLLIKNIYRSREVQGRFDYHAWIKMSGRVNSDELLLDILNQFRRERKENIRHESVDVSTQLSRYLKKDRFLLVLDEITSEHECNHILNALPKDWPGSIVIVITRDANVASSYVEFPGHMHNLPRLPAEEAWKLFCKRAFAACSEKCPPDLEDLARKIVHMVDGNPYAIAAAGSLLSKKQRIPVVWKKFHDSVGAEIGADSRLSIVTHVIRSSYKDLPAHLRVCYLYFGMFPEDYSVKRGRLIRSWIAEGFVIESAGMTLEDVAEGYLNELVTRSLVNVSAKEIDGRVRSCQVSNLVRKFIISKCAEANFAVTRANLGEKIRRLSVHSDFSNFPQEIDLKRVRAFFVLANDNIFNNNMEIFGQFGLLRVLDLEHTHLENFPDEILSLTLLRCLSLRHTRIRTIPKSINKLAFLETLDLKQTYVTLLPRTISKLSKLRHLLVYRYNVKNYVCYDSVHEVHIFEGIQQLTSLHKLSLVNVSKHRKIIKHLGELINLRKLGLTHLSSRDGKNLCVSIEKMVNLSTLDVRAKEEEYEYLDLDDMKNPPPYLQRLYLKGRLNSLPSWITSLHSLIKIGLRWSKLSSNPFETLQDLPHLMELEITDFYTGEELEFRAEKFKNLRILNMDKFDKLHQMTVQSGAMPLLEKLTISRCRNLELLPLGIESLTQLQKLILYDMPKEFIAKLRKDHEDSYVIDHVRVIHAFSLEGQSWSFQNLS